MAKTKAQIRNRALQMLGKLALGQTAEAELASDIEDAYDQVYSDLSTSGLVTWLSTSVPDEFVEDVAALVAASRSEGIPMERYQKVISKAAQSYINISRKITGRYNNPRNVEDF